ncbi:MAG: BREX-4 system phosphatase PglZ [Victivallaceae bacterium]
MMDTIESCLKKLQAYLASDSFRQPMFVNVDSRDDLCRLKNELPAGMKKCSVADFCNKSDENPSFDTMLDQLAQNADKTLLTDLIPALELQGEPDLQRILSSLSTLAIQGKLVILCYQAMRYFNDFNDPRFARRFIRIGGKITPKPNVVFIPADLAGAAMKPQMRFIQELIRQFESVTVERIFVITGKRKADYPGSLLFLSEQTNAYDILAEIDGNITSVLEKAFGTPEQWKKLLKIFPAGQTWSGVIRAEFGVDSNLAFLIKNWNEWDEFHRWLYFVTLKINTKNELGYLFRAATYTEAPNRLVRSIYRELLKISHSDKAFNRDYQERKNLLASLENPDDEVADFCLYVDCRGRDAIYYLTNNTQQEREKILSYLGIYEYSQDELKLILSLVYPEIAAYLTPYNFGIPLFDDYFQRYKIQKITNRIVPSFETLVNQQALARDYNHLVATRCSVTEKLGGSDICAYWIDALGVEFLGYIMVCCQAFGLMANVTVCRANLPTITSLNKEFVEDFQNAGTNLAIIKELDEIKHQGKENFDYEKTKLPIHLIRELEIVNDVIKSAFQKLKSGKYQKAIIVSDHGASRLAVIKENTMDFDVDSKGTHGGRCCAYSASLPKIETATIEDGYYVLAGYNRFKGGRKASVETHGGATLEEVLVPIVVLSLRDVGIEVSFMANIITVSFRKKAAIKLFSKTKLSEVSMCINQNFYKARPDGNNWMFEMPDLKRPGIYYADIYENKNLIAEHLSFQIVKESARENDLL